MTAKGKRVKAWVVINPTADRPFLKMADDQYAVFKDKASALSIGYGEPIPCFITYTISEKNEK